MPGPVILEQDGNIATVILNNPERMNALSRPMWQLLGETMQNLSADAALRCVILRGAGTKAFGAGADISEFRTERANSRAAKEYGEVIHRTMQAVAQCTHPTVAMINGACIGGGAGGVARGVADDKGEEESLAAARRIAEGAPLVARWHKKFLRRLADSTPITQAEWDEGFACFDSEDYRAGVEAFLDKREPKIRGTG